MEQIKAIRAMEAHAERFGVKLTTVGQLAVGNRHAYDRLKKGTAHRATAARILDWIKRDIEARAASHLASPISAPLSEAS